MGNYGQTGPPERSGKSENSFRNEEQGTSHVEGPEPGDGETGNSIEN